MYDRHRSKDQPPDGATLVGDEKIGESPVYVTRDGKFVAWIGDHWLSRANLAALRQEAAARIAPTTVMDIRSLGSQYRESRWVAGRGYVRDPSPPRPFDRLQVARYERGKWTLANGNRTRDHSDLIADDPALEADLLAMIQAYWAFQDRWEATVKARARKLDHDENGAPRFREPEAAAEMPMG